MLGGIQRPVSGFKQPGGGAAWRSVGLVRLAPGCLPAGALRVVAGNADAQRDMLRRGRRQVRDGQALHRHQDALGHALGATARRAGQQQRKLLAAIARDHVGRALAGGLQQVGDGLQAGIAGRMAVAVIEQLEMVHIQQQQGQRITAAPAALPLARQRGIKAAPVGHIGQGVDGGHAAQLVGHLLDAQLRLDAGQHQRGADRLGDEIGRAKIEAADLKRRLVVAGDKDHRYLGQIRVGLQVLADFEAAHAGHFGVEKNQVGRHLTGQAQRVGTVGGKVQLGNAVEDAAQEPNGAGVVVDQKNAWPG